MFVSNIQIDFLKTSIPLKYTDDYEFIKIKYDKRDLLIQTSKLYCRYGSRYDTIELSFQNIVNDSKLKILRNDLSQIQNYIETRYSKYCVYPIIKRNSINVKIRNVRIFDERKKKLENIPSNSYGRYIIHISGFWINKRDIFVQLNAIQTSIEMPLVIDECLFDTKKIPKPPPLPVFKKTDNKIKIVRKNKQIKSETKTISVPSLSEIQIALQRLKKR
tara:strand:+ start:728 stop:1381 length:654 start_codon:yes stop_codon:yes gene_type:complete